MLLLINKSIQSIDSLKHFYEAQKKYINQKSQKGMKELAISQIWWQFLLIAVACYFIGCFNFARLISKLKHKDITKMGSGNPGTMNMSREFGMKIGVLTFLCDALKGGVPLLIGHLIYNGCVFAGTEVLISYFIRYFCIFFVITWHIYPVTTGFKGGKGIASTMGAFWFSLSCENLWWILGRTCILAIISTLIGCLIRLIFF